MSLGPSLIWQDETTAARRRIYFRLVQSADSVSPRTGATGTGFFSKNGAAAAASTNNIVEVDAGDQPGLYYIEPTATEHDTLGNLVFTFDDASSLPGQGLGQVVDYDPYSAPDAARFDAIDTQLDAIETTLATLNGKLDTIDNFLDTEMAAVLAAVDTEVAAIKAKTDSLTFTNANKVDAAVLTAADFVAAVREAVADALLGRSIAGSANGGRTVRSALRRVRNRVAIAAGTMTVYAEDDTTPDHTAAVTTAAGNPISEVNPA